MKPAAIIDALGRGKQGDAVYQALLRLRRKGLIRAHGKTSYVITAAGISSLDLPPHDTRPWKEDTRLTTLHADYRLTERLRPEDRPASSRVEVFKSVVVSVRHERRMGPQLTDGDTVVIKTLPNVRLAELQSLADDAAAQYLRHLAQTFSAEIRKLQASSGLSRVARTLDWGWERVSLGEAGSFDVPFVVQEYINGLDLPTFLAERAGLFGDLEQWFEFAQSLALGVKEVHAAGTFHRHIWPGTIFLPVDRKIDGPVCVDLMEAVFYAPSWQSNSASSAPHQVSQLDDSLFVAPEWRGNLVREPRRSADLYSVGAVLYYTLTGRAPQFTEDISPDELKEEIHQDLSQSIASDNFGVADIISRCLRYSVDEKKTAKEHRRVSDVYTVLSDIRTFSGARRGLIDVGVTIARSVLRLAETTGVFASLAATELEQLEPLLADLESGSVTIRGEHNDFVLKLCSYLSTLASGDEYWAVTVPDFWKSVNLGIRGRYLSMNAEIARRGAKVLRVFLLTEDDMGVEEVEGIVSAHLEVQRELHAKKKEFDVRYKLVTAAERETEKEASVGMWVRGESLVKVQAHYYLSKPETINRITISQVREGKDDVRRSWLSRFLEGSRPLQKWMDDAEKRRGC